MNRAEQRRAKHDARRAMRSSGCTCRPTFIESPASDLPPGVTTGGWVRHQLGCVLGDQIAAKNRLGIIPSLLLQSSPSDECTR